MFVVFFFFNDTATTEIYTLSLHDALPISAGTRLLLAEVDATHPFVQVELLMPVLPLRSEEHTSELQSPCNLVCRLLLEKKKRHWRHGDEMRIWTMSHEIVFYVSDNVWVVH